MITTEEIKNRLEGEYEKVKVFSVGSDKVPVIFACNLYDKSFTLVSIYMGSEIGGHFKLEPTYRMDYVHEHFDVVQAESLLNTMIIEIQNENVEVIGDVNPKKLN